MNEFYSISHRCSLYHIPVQYYAIRLRVQCVLPAHCTLFQVAICCMLCLALMHLPYLTVLLCFIYSYFIDLFLDVSWVPLQTRQGEPWYKFLGSAGRFLSQSETKHTKRARPFTNSVPVLTKRKMTTGSLCVFVCLWTCYICLWCFNYLEPSQKYINLAKIVA